MKSLHFVSQLSRISYLPYRMGSGEGRPLQTKICEMGFIMSTVHTVRTVWWYFIRRKCKCLYSNLDSYPFSTIVLHDKSSTSSPRLFASRKGSKENRSRRSFLVFQLLNLQIMLFKDQSLNTTSSATSFRRVYTARAREWQYKHIGKGQEF